MTVQSGLLAQKIGAGQGQTTGFAEEHRHSRSATAHGLEIQGLTHSTLRSFEPQGLHQ